MTLEGWLEWAEFHTEWLPVVREAAVIIQKQATEIEDLQKALRSNLRPAASGP